MMRDVGLLDEELGGVDDTMMGRVEPAAESAAESPEVPS